MKKKPVQLGQRNQKPLITKGDINGPVSSYFLQGDELERYRRMPPDDRRFDPKLGRPPGGGAA